MDYIIHLMILVGIYLILAQAFNLNFGVGHLFNLAHVASYAIGAYVTALLSTVPTICNPFRIYIPIPAGRFLWNASFYSEYVFDFRGIPGEWSFFPCIVSSMVISGLFAILIGAISLKLSQDYFAIGTLAFSSVVSALLINWKSLTRGVLGIPGIPRPEIMEIDFYNNRNFLVLMFLAVIIAQVFLYFVFRSPYARTLRCQAEFEQAALALAKNTRRARNISFFLASMFAGLAGAFFAYYINYIDPSSFSLTEMIFILTIVVVGKPGSFWGCIAGSFFLVLLPEPLRFIEIPPSVLGPLRQMIYALILFIVVLINRSRLFPVERKV